MRLAFAAAHVVMRGSYRDVAHSLQSPGSAGEIAAHLDWDATLALRRRLDSLGFAIAEAMDTAQRFQLGWDNARRLIEQLGRAKLANGFIAGAGADGAASDDRDALHARVVEQARAIRAAGGDVILLPIPALALRRAAEAEYVEFYGRVIDALDGPLYVHWLGPMFMPALEGYFPGDSFRRVMAHDPAKVRGAKLSLLDDRLEIALRAELLARDQIVLTGDDLHFADLVAGEGPVLRTTRAGRRDVALGAFSHALLGVLDAIADPAALALRLLAHGDRAAFVAILRPCEALARVLFEPPVQHYKVGLAFLSWLNGHQSEFLLVNHEERARGREHLLRVAALAKECGAIDDSASVEERLRRFAARRAT